MRASHFDSEGFRLRYDRHGADELAVEFAIAMPGAADFKHYTGGVVHRAR